MAHLQRKLEWAQELAWGHLQQAQAKQKQLYDRTTRPCQFQAGDRVLVRSQLFPKVSSQE